jgi:hypothetical protein
LKPSAKGGLALSCIIKKSGSWQIAVKAFLDAAVSDVMLLDE